MFCVSFVHEGCKRFKRCSFVSARLSHVKPIRDLRRLMDVLSCAVDIRGKLEANMDDDTSTYM